MKKKGSHYSYVGTEGFEASHRGTAFRPAGVLRRSPVGILMYRFCGLGMFRLSHFP